MDSWPTGEEVRGAYDVLVRVAFSWRFDHPGRVLLTRAGKAMLDRHEEHEAERAALRGALGPVAPSRIFAGTSDTTARRALGREASSPAMGTAE